MLLLGLMLRCNESTQIILDPHIWCVSFKIPQKSITRPRVLLHLFIIELQLQVAVLLRIVDTTYVTVAWTLHNRRRAVVVSVCCSPLTAWLMPVTPPCFFARSKNSIIFSVTAWSCISRAKRGLSSLLTRQCTFEAGPVWAQVWEQPGFLLTN